MFNKSILFQYLRVVVNEKKQHMPYIYLRTLFLLYHWENSFLFQKQNIYIFF